MKSYQILGRALLFRGTSGGVSAVVRFLLVDFRPAAADRVVSDEGIERVLASAKGPSNAVCTVSGLLPTALRIALTL